VISASKADHTLQSIVLQLGKLTITVKFHPNLRQIQESQCCFWKPLHVACLLCN
jgi:hypothetical protein